MPSPKPAISLRRPPSAPPPAVIESFVRGAATEAATPPRPAAPAPEPGAAVSLHLVAPEAAEAATASAEPAVETESSEARVPAASAHVAAAGVRDEASEPASQPKAVREPKQPTTAKSKPTKAADVLPTRTGLIQRKNRVRRRTAIYFDPSVQKKLAIYCTINDFEMSEVVETAVRKYLEEQG